ncbi:MAG: glycoside hydrolase family 43 protein [Massilibacteroides sp.]|nr:glycoside hydrolase family 43 protein [Massilibacteroides sp.]MDD3061582.1 glycoside hydrolase family 43 protein [Massilibacteroides sp.]MDD4114940.1 glycoside hydrolase family 43 protein [Massilibacteroides sp.]MDD4659129.1 glycoside hydrolase family 43 protein [Massilibacteroides sp.]
MKKKHSFRINFFFSLLVLSLILPGCSVNQNSKKQVNENGESVAYFDYFAYVGNDNYYNNHPLTEEDQFYNPILPGWYSDPSICTNGTDYFLVTSTFTYYPGVPIFHSTDLVNWEQIGYVLDRPSQLLNMEGQHISGGIFAPAISYNPHNQTYYMITTNVGAGNFFVKTKDPFDSWSDPIFLPEVGGIDPSFFFDEDGRAYIINNDGMDGKELYDGHRSIRIREFDVETDQTKGSWKMLVNGGVNLAEKPIWIEGPHMYKINGKYYLMAAEGGTGTNHTEVIFSGNAPMGDFTPWEKNPILTQKHLAPDRPDPITCAGHADLIQTKEGDWWAVFLACRPINNEFENLGRETFMMPVKWSDDGFPYMTQGDDLIPLVLKRDGVKRNENVTFGNFIWKDDFDKTALGMEWLTLRAPASDLYSLTNEPGFLQLVCSDISATEKKTPAFVTRRMQHHQFECTTSIEFDPETEQEKAGILLFKNEKNQYFFSIGQKDGQKIVGLNQTVGSKSIPETERIIKAPKGAPVYLKVISSGTFYSFYYRCGEGEWEMLCDSIDAKPLSTAVAGGFTGSTIGLYAVKTNH